MIRLKNYLSSAFILSFVYFFYTKMEHFKDYFNVDNKFIYDNGKISFGYDLNSLEVLKIAYLSYLIFLAGFYLFQSDPKEAKALLALKALKNIIRKPFIVFKNGLDKKEKVALLTIIVKAFFIPLMLSWLTGHITSLLVNTVYVIEHKNLIFTDFISIYKSHLFWMLFEIIVFLDVFFYTIGYIVEFKFLKNEIISVEPTLMGWVVALICYPPFNDSFSKMLPWQSTDFPQFENSFWLVVISVLMLISMGIYTWASVSLNFKASNLTYRGIVAKGPYAYIRHPAYICKNFTWWLGSIPNIFISFQAIFITVSSVGISTAVFDDIFHFCMVILSLSTWTFVYFFRALTEERHLRSIDNEYDQYAKKVKYMFIPSVI